MVNDTEEYMKI